ncbi:hypothetical protein LCGC14_3044700 [marine sediment metagenome]|uniref:Uncharacterized protein n=1 Tax=marine sediment metagenome TaxID=412755 RepID=A0A0F8WNI6_9ZZZZ
MTVEEYALIQISRSNKLILDSYKLAKRESYNIILDDLIEFGEENDFRNLRIKNLTKNLENKENAKIKAKQRAISKIG